MHDPFARLARWYDRLFHRQDPRPLEGLLRLTPGARLLDLGGGTGRVAQDLREVRVIVCDISAAMLGEARQKGLVACQGRAEELPFGGGVLDGILVMDSFHHMSGHRQAVREMLRVVRPGGRIVLLEPDPRHRSMRLIHRIELMLGMESHFFTLEELGELFRAAGGSVVQAEPGPGLNVHLVVTRE